MKKSYTLEEINLELIQKMLIHPEVSYRRSLLQSSLLSEKDLKNMICNDQDLRLRKEAAVELEKRLDSKRRRKRTKTVIDYTKMDLKGLSIGNEDYEDLINENNNQEKLPNNLFCFKGEIFEIIPNKRNY